jgi:DNA-directed RNA polymerase subunit RPC12/RpoP
MAKKTTRIVCPWCGATYNTSIIYQYIVYQCPTCGHRYKLSADLQTAVKVVEVGPAWQRGDV